jgi:hypothetical protein
MQPAFKLNLRQQRLVDTVITQARKQSGLQVLHNSGQGWTYSAIRTSRGVITWKVVDGHGHTLVSGECA